MYKFKGMGSMVKVITVRSIGRLKRVTISRGKLTKAEKDISPYVLY